MLLYISPFIILQIHCVLSNYLNADPNFRKQKLERNNIVNKGVWVRSSKDAEKATSNFLFRDNAIDVDNLVVGDFNPFADPNSLFIAKYVERNKRSSAYLNSRYPRKNERSANSIYVDNDKERSRSEKRDVISKLKPTIIFNEYPYEIVPILLGNDKQDLVETKNYSTYVVNELIKNEMPNMTVIPLKETIENTSSKIDTVVDYRKVNTTFVPERPINDLENKVQKRFDAKNCNNNTQDDHNRIEQDNKAVFAKETKEWQAAPVPNNYIYKHGSKSEDNKFVRPVTERGLIKVLSTLTNAFKKMMKQHSDIKLINKKVTSMYEEFVKNLEIISDKFQDFETKYANLVALNQKLMEIDDKMNAKEVHCKAKERQLLKNLIDFEIQQKKFLTQQRQFYDIQKLMLAQNDRINSKQNAIAKTQSEISHRQNNFARILKKAKQIYMDPKLNTPKPKVTSPKLESHADNEFESSQSKDTVLIERSTTTTTKPQSNESVKINLFSIPTPSRLVNQDHLLLNEKDKKPVDDLVYKYYFNNTFIESLMRNFVSSFMSIGEHNDELRNAKSKRDEATEKTTLLLPVDKAENVKGKSVARERRWINHHSRKKWRHRNKGKYVDDINNNTDDEKMVKDTKKPVNHLLDAPSSKTLQNEGKDPNLHKSDPFVMMATSFCNGIGQNQTTQVLSWCVEKALRRLQNIDIKMPPPPAPEVPKVSESEKISVFKPVQYNTKTTVAKEVSETAELQTTQAPVPSPQPKAETLGETLGKTLVTEPPASVMYTPLSTIVAQTTHNLNVFFPDNDQLETNLKEFDLQPDTEGNVYYDGSLHASDMIRDRKNKDGSSESDAFVGLEESNSRIDHMDPETFDPGNMRRAFLRRMKYASMLKEINKLKNIAK